VGFRNWSIARRCRWGISRQWFPMHSGFHADWHRLTILAGDWSLHVDSNAFKDAPLFVDADFLFDVIRQFGETLQEMFWYILHCSVLSGQWPLVDKDRVDDET